MMAVKRVTIELDDSPDTARSTGPPATLISKKKNLPEKIQKTATPEYQEDYQGQEAKEKGQNGPYIPETIGRTPSDLVFAFINRPEFMATALTFLAFLIFITKLQKLNDFLFPIVTASLLNIVWFGAIAIRRITSYYKKK